MKKTNLDTISAKYRISDYKELCAKVIDLIDSQKIKPVKASGYNGKSPALYREYWVIEEKQDVSQYVNELNYEIVPAISTDYYHLHIDQYIQDRQWVLLLNDYIKKRDFMTLMSENERSFDIWHREKFLKQEQGKKILKRCGLETDFLHYYRTTEPIAYYSATRKTPQNLLIIENKDTFYSMRKCLMYRGQNRSDGEFHCESVQSNLTKRLKNEAENNMYTICGEQIGTLIYGAGKGVIAAFSDFDISGEPYMMEQGNEILYFGDLDYEGIGIYENFAAAYGEQYNIQLFKNGYEMMIAKADSIGVDNLPFTKEGQNRNIGNLFFNQFSKMAQAKMKEILEQGRYIPQEILNIEDFMAAV
ncbi:MAG: hypothetical protein K2G55_03150 [Lachnospiraceae bacterium]|nr:hypothetical protein [Lachnospiraceae bacterium]MDE7204471.1 hypothetical protein [Lachnospiraceae bacterium]